ncbi:MAG TPA: hypothetical protein DCM27_04430 [Rhodospirillaceae bacterium]|nr:hypothetical protein [Rhodospirillaceae bacterium]
MTNMYKNKVAMMSDADRAIEWKNLWGGNVPSHLSRPMIERSLIFKMMERDGLGLNEEQQNKLEQLVASYKRNPQSIERNNRILPGSRIVKIWKGKRYSVEVTDTGFRCGDINYSSLSQVASAVTGTRWNGWVFFDLKKHVTKMEAV